MPYKHELKAEDFIIEPTLFGDWYPIATHPRDASVFEVRVGNGPIARATWNAKYERLELEPGSNEVDKMRLTEWRYLR
jgi:hypothetical protein